MRTKTLLLTAALGVAGVATTIAQVYSVNAVGYVNLTLAPGLAMIANPLDAGTGNNTVGKLLTAVPDGTLVYKFTGTTYDINTFVEALGGWTAPDMTLAPGEGAFISVPAQAKVTFVGEVMQGDLSNPVPAGLSIRASQVPQAAKLTADLKFPAGDGDVVYTWAPSTQSYGVFTFVEAIGGWVPEDPVIAVGQSFFVSKVTAAAWARTFSVNQ